MRQRVVIVGGSAAGMAAAGRAKRLDPDLDVCIVEAGEFISYSICGVPYYLTGQVESRDRLIHYTPETLEQETGIRVQARTRALSILPGRRQLLCEGVDGASRHHLQYDKLVIATGYRPRLLDLDKRVDGLFTVSRLQDALRLREALPTSGHAIVVGAGYVGLMMAESLGRCGLSVTLLEQGRCIYTLVDPDMGDLVQGQLQDNGVDVRLQHKVTELVTAGDRLTGVRAGRHVFECDLAVVDVGVLPDTRLATESGIALGVSGGIAVDARGMTSLPDVFAAGNCAETSHLVTGRPIVSSLATSAARQGRVVGENLAGRRSEFRGTLETSVEKVFDLGVGRTGLTLSHALRSGYRAMATRISARDRSAYYPGSRKIHVKLVYERRSNRLLGGQIIGSQQAAKRIDTLSVALTAGLNLSQISQLDLAYAPPFGTLWDPIQVAANVALRES